MIKIEIDDNEYQVKEGSTIIENADNLGISIPRFCYHNKLSIAANCRMCLVQIDSAPKPIPACATTVTEGMKIWTKSKITKSAQKDIMEFLLINHPLDCPICDQGGECELQDVSMEYGNDISQYSEPKRAVQDEDLGPLISTAMTRCIHCTRCVRFGSEIAGMRELGATSRGEFMQIGTFIEKSIESEVSGNVIDLCPVGALTSKPFRFKARSIEMEAKPYISIHDALGSNIFMHTRRNEVMRVVPREKDSLNEIWISDRDRFSYEALLHADRLRFPKLKENDGLHDCSWIKSLEKTVQSIQHALNKYGPNEIAVLVGNNISLEEAFLLKRFLANFGISNIEHRLKQKDFRLDSKGFNIEKYTLDVSDLENKDNVLIVGSIVQKEFPVLGIKLLKATKKKAIISSINPIKVDTPYEIQNEVISSNYFTDLIAIAKVLDIDYPYLNKVEVKPTKIHKDIANKLSKANNVTILIGKLAIESNYFTEIVYLSELIKQKTNTKISILNTSANTALTSLGLIPDYTINEPRKNELNNSVLDNQYKAYILYQVEPEYDSYLGKTITKNLSSAKLVISFSYYGNDFINKYAHIILPTTPYSEQSGSMQNIVGEIQNYTAAVTPYGEARPGWKILRVLGNVAEMDQFSYDNVEQVTNEVQSYLKQLNSKEISSDKNSNSLVSSIDLSSIEPILTTVTNNLKPEIIITHSLYHADSITRRSKPLQQTPEALAEPVLSLNNKTSKALNILNNNDVTLKTKQGKIKLKVKYDDKVADNIIWINNFEKIGSLIGDLKQGWEIQA